MATQEQVEEIMRQLMALNEQLGVSREENRILREELGKREHEQKAWSELHFLESDLLEAQRRGESARCARCKVLEDPTWNTRQFACQRCNTEKPLHA